jgi:cyanophycinase
MSETPLAPIYLLADSRLLFWQRPDGSLFLKEVAQATNVERPSAAYIGASNDDNLEFYHGIFEPAMQQIECGECRMILKRPSANDAKFLERAEIILLAGGSVEKGWRAFEQNGLQQLIPRRFVEGAVLVGVSAGAVQLGRGWLAENGTLLQTFSLLPFFVSAHEEQDDWESLRRVVALADGPCQGIGLPFGGGAVYHAGELEPIAKPIFELTRDERGVRESLAFPALDGANAPEMFEPNEAAR